jgi:hypothetical protein
MADGIRRVYMAHVTRYAENAAFVHEVADGFAAIQAGDVEWEEAYDDAGEPIRGLLVRSFRRLRPAQRRLSLSGCSEANLMSSSQYEAGADRACAVAS